MPTLIPSFMHKALLTCLYGMLGLFTIIIHAQEGDISQTQTKRTSALSQYWLNQDALDLLPEPKPSLSPQCPGVFYQGKVEQQEALEINASQTISADSAIYEADGTALFKGNVILNQGGQSISGDFVRYQQKQDSLDITGNVQIEKSGLLIMSEHAHYNNANKSSELKNAEFLMFANGLNGRAQAINISETETNVLDSSITSCPPGNENWLLKSKELHLDQEKGWGYAKQASLHLAKVPVLYTPYFTFPLDERRKSGFLFPSLGSDSINGVDITLPYYLNLAPNYDATLSPRILSKRGTQMAAELRYLNAIGEGSISGSYLGQDEINTLYSERKQVQWNHRVQFADHWSINTDYVYVSDNDYFDDLDSFSNTSSLGYLERTGSISYVENRAYFSVLVQDFLLLDSINPTNQAYRLAPQVHAGLSQTLFHPALDANLDAQITRFERDLDSSNLTQAEISSGTLSTGTRLVLQPGFSADFSRAAYFLKPAMRLHHRQYQLNDYQALGQSQDLDIDIPIYSLDSGLIFERTVDIAQTDYTQTLEPRIKLIKIAYQDQSAIPHFDTGLLSFSREQLYRDRRYSGHDLVGDTEQITLGLASRIYDETGNEKAGMHLGQIAYLKDRQIQLSNDENPEAELSPLVADVLIQLIPNWSLSQKILWDSENNTLDQVASGLYYKNALNNIFNVEYRYRPGDILSAQKEVQTSFVWPISNHWKAMSFWNYDLNQHTTTELASGLEYENCCVIVRALNQKWLRRVSNSSFESANKQSLELQLKGLGNLNNQISDYLSTKIPGFNN